MEVTNEIKAKVFAQYNGQKGTTDHPNYKVCVINGATPKGVFINSATGFDALKWGDNPVLILKPLSSTTDEDAIEVSKIAFSKTSWTVANGKLIMDKIFNESSCAGFTPKEMIQIFQYFQSKGYDLPNYLLGGKTLKEAGLAIYE